MRKPERWTIGGAAPTGSFHSGNVVGASDLTMGNKALDSKAAARPLIAILPRWLVIAIALLAFAAVSGLFVWAFVNASSFEGTFARFILCLSIALYLGLFLFIIYPWGYRLTKIPYVDLSVEVVGPAALFIILFVFLLRTMPAPAAGRLHVFVDRQQH